MHHITEVAIIKDINNHCKLKLTYGRYTKTKDECFLLYENTTAEFEHLMQISNWLDKICNVEYQLDLPIKITAPCSIVILNVPSQWNEQMFGSKLKQHYPSIAQAVCLFVKGKRPLNKVHLDFSTYKELSNILKTILDDNNTAFTIGLCQLPTGVFRCYNCRAYNDHITAHCPNKNNQVCFRCEQHHAYNLRYKNSIRCVHCNGSHIAGIPACPEKNRTMKRKKTMTGITK